MLAVVCLFRKVAAYSRPAQLHHCFGFFQALHSSKIPYSIILQLLHPNTKIQSVVNPSFLEEPCLACCQYGQHDGSARRARECRVSSFRSRYLNDHGEAQLKFCPWIEYSPLLLAQGGFIAPRHQNNPLSPSLNTVRAALTIGWANTVPLSSRRTRRLWFWVRREIWRRRKLCGFPHKTSFLLALTTSTIVSGIIRLGIYAPCPLEGTTATKRFSTATNSCPKISG